MWSNSRVGEKEWYQSENQKSKAKKERKSRLNKNQTNKENQSLTEEKSNVSSKNKEEWIQKVADTKISRWIEVGSKNNWLSFKNN